MIKKPRSLEQIDKELAEIDSMLAGTDGSFKEVQQNQQVDPNINQSLPQESAITQNRSIADIDAELAEIDSILGSEQENGQKPVTALETTGRGVKGFLASGPGGLADLFLKFVNLVGKENLMDDSAFSEEFKNMSRADAERLISENQIQPNAQKTLEGVYHDVTGLPVRKPGEDMLGDIVQTVGDIVSPGIPGTGPLRNLTKGAPVLKTVGKTLAKDAAMATGASTALHTTPSLTEEGTWGRVAEDFGKMVLGSAVGGASASKAAGAVRSFKDFPGNVVDAAKGIKDIPANTVSRILMGQNPNTEIFELAKKHGVELPFNVGSDSSIANFTANNYLKTMFASDKYKSSLKKADESMIDAIKDVIDSLGDSNFAPKEASDNFKSFLKFDESRLRSEVESLYNAAYKLAENGEKVKPTKTAGFINSQRIQDLINTSTKSDSTKKIIMHIQEIAQGLGISLKESDLKRYKDKPDLIKKIKTAHIENLPEVDLKKLIEDRKEIGRITKYDKDAKGVNKYLDGLISVLTEDIKSSKNEQFLKKLNEANIFFKKNIGQRFDNPKIAKAVMSEKIAIDAFNKMNTVEGVRQLKKLSGNSKEGQEFFDALKKAKLRDMLSSSVGDDYVQPGRLNTLISKKCKQSELIKELLGQSEYEKIYEISKIAKEFSDSGRELLNTSMTTPVAKDMQRFSELKDAITSMFKTSSAAASVAGAYGVAGPFGAVAAIATPNLISRLVSSPKFIEQLRKYAISRKAGNQKEADTILKRMFTIMNDTENKVRIGKEAITTNLEEEEE